MLKDRIKKFRTKAHMTQEALAERLCVSRALVQKWETGKRYPEESLLHTLASVFNVSYDELIKGDSRAIDSADELSECLDGSEGSTSSGDEDIARLAENLTAFLKSLPAFERKCFIRRYYYFSTPEEIAKDFRTSQEEINTVLKDLRQRLRSYMEGEK